MKTVTIEGKNITDIPSFYEEINRVFMEGEDWKLGNSLDALNDLLYGSYGTITDTPAFQLVWKDSESSKEALGLPATIAFYEAKLEPGSPFNKKWAEDKLTELKGGAGQTYYEMVAEIISQHPTIEFLAQ